MTLLRPVLYTIGLLLSVIGAAMLVPAVVDAMAGNPDWQAFAISASITLFIAGSLTLGLMVKEVRLDLRQAFLLTALSWTVCAAFAALPFRLAQLKLDYADAFFEGVSGLTTTGSTVLVGLDGMPPGILLWRALLQWLGGLGIIAMAIAILPYLRVGGMQLFRTESSDRFEKILPRPGQYARAIATLYVALTSLCALAYWAGGMPGFDAITHAMTTLATGGYSTSDASMGHFQSATIQWTGVLFMLLGALPFVLYLRVIGLDFAALWRDGQVRALVAFLAAVTLLLALNLALTNDVPLLDALRLAAFNVVSVTTTTGFATADYGAWGSFALVLFFVLTFIGGCTGSTSGGIKIFRFQVLRLFVDRQMRRLYFPQGVVAQRYKGKPLPREVASSVVGFFFIYIMGFAVLTLALAATGLDLVTSTSGAATAIGNVGPGLGPIIGPAGNFSTLPDVAKWLLSAGMLLGRLELFTVLILLLPGFWRW
ncbi:MAG: TrkH family potassium uptake protein [Kiloniellales bacterium]